MAAKTLPEHPTRKVPTHCKRGHEFSEENTGRTRLGHRFCRECDRQRKAAHRNRTKATREEQVSVTCPKCQRERRVVRTTARRLESMPRLCRSCSRSETWPGMTFTPRPCAKCGKRFSGRSGAARFCDGCAGRKPVAVRACPVCGEPYTGYRSKTACSDRCRRRLWMNRRYFGGKLFDADGWGDKICRLCERDASERPHVHHVFGHPNHDHLVVLCAGCHDTVSTLAQRDTYGDEQFERLRWYALAQRLGRDPDAAQQAVAS